MMTGGLNKFTADTKAQESDVKNLWNSHQKGTEWSIFHVSY